MTLRHVFIVEDSALVTDALELLLEEAGYRVTIARSIADATSHFADSPVDVLLLDLGLPDGDGLGLLDALRDRTLLPDAIFALTGHDDATTRQRCVAKGCSGVLVKPVPIAELLLRVSAPSA